MSTTQEPVLQQLLGLHDIDLEIMRIEREIDEGQTELASMGDQLTALQSGRDRLETELERLRAEARKGERAVDEKRATLDRLRTRVSQVQNERQYGAATLEFDLVRQDLRKLEDFVLEKMQRVEELESQAKELGAQLEGASEEAGPRRQQIEARLKQLKEQLAIQADRRQNRAIRLDPGALRLYDRIRSGRSGIAVAPLTGEGVCGFCFTAVTVQQEMQIKGMATLICCEGCGVILYPDDLKR